MAHSFFELCERYTQLAPESLARCARLPAMVDVASRLLSTQRAPSATAAAASFLTATARATRFDSGALSQALARVFGGQAGEQLLRHALLGVHGAMPLASVPAVAHVLAPLLGMPAWRDGGRTDAWVLSALRALPIREGIPDSNSLNRLLYVLTNLPDAAADGRLNPQVVDDLQTALLNFAQVCRRLHSAHGSYVTA
eukprot:6173725-Pleurochrysis_carterae.AAC.2